MKMLTAAALAATLLSAPAFAYGTSITLPVFTFPGDAADAPTQGCTSPLSGTVGCEE